MRHHAHVGDAAIGPSWRRHGVRRTRGARIARLLRPVAHLMGGLASTELAVSLGGRWHRPDVGVVLHAPIPVDGVLRRAPLLVVRLGGPPTAADWLGAGARAVWAWEGGRVVELRRDGRRIVDPGVWLVHPDEPALRLAGDELRPPSWADARMSA